MAANMAKGKWCLLAIALILPICSSVRIGSKSKTIHLAPEYTQKGEWDGYTRVRRSPQMQKEASPSAHIRKTRQAPNPLPTTTNAQVNKVSSIFSLFWSRKVDIWPDNDVF